MCYTNDIFGSRSGLRHLPLRKRREPAFITTTVPESFARAMRHKSKKELRGGKILKLILFGSYARGGWIADLVVGYFSDYDILAVVSEEACAEPQHWYKTEDFLLEEELACRLKAPVGLIVHSMEDMNKQCAVGRPFFMDILRDV